MGAGGIWDGQGQNDGSPSTVKLPTIFTITARGGGRACVGCIVGRPDVHWNSAGNGYSGGGSGGSAPTRGSVGGTNGGNGGGSYGGHGTGEGLGLTFLGTSICRLERGGSLVANQETTTMVVGEGG